jgi:tetratricopeptide (TPR) repeat protein
LALSIRLNSLDPAYHLALARSYEWQARSEAFDSALAQTWLDKAIASVRRATELRPVWAEAWVNLALVKAYRGDLDEEATYALQLALSLAPWEPRTLEDSVIAGMLMWPALDAPARSQFRQAVDRLFTLGRGQFVVDAALRYGWAAEVDAHIPLAHDLRRYLNAQRKVLSQ